MVPGPTVLLIVAHALKEGPCATLPTTAGVVAGDALAVTVTLVGLGALLAASATLFEVLKWLGAAYLVWLGIRTLMEKPHGTGEAAAKPTASSRRLAGRAFIVTALNPKSIAFFIAFVPQFLRPGTPLMPQFTALIATFVVMGGVNALAYALAADRLRARIRRPGVLTWMNRAGGGALVTMGTLTATLSRS